MGVQKKQNCKLFRELRFYFENSFKKRRNEGGKNAHCLIYEEVSRDLHKDSHGTNF